MINFNNGNGVSFIHPDLLKIREELVSTKDAIAGTQAVKRANARYLPAPSLASSSDDNRACEAKYEAYCNRAVWYGVTGRTHEGLVGALFAKEPTLILPASLEPLKERATNKGVGLIQTAKMLARAVCGYSRGAIFVDYSAAGEGRPFLFAYDAWDVTNWREQEINGEDVYTLIVLREKYPISDDGFQVKSARQFRVLRLVDGVATAQIYRESRPTEIELGTWAEDFPKQFDNVSDIVVLTKHDGTPWDRIPCVIAGAFYNDASVEKPVLYDIAEVEFGLYRNSASFEQLCYYLGEPTPWASGLTDEWLETAMGGSIKLGSAGGVALPVNGKFGIAQVQSDQLLNEAMSAKLRQMVALGARLVQQQQVQRTAFEASMESASESSVIASIGANISAAMTQALEWAAGYVGAESEEIVFKLNSDFNFSLGTPEMIRETSSAYAANLITFTEARGVLRNAGIATEDDEVVKQELEAQAAASFQREIDLLNASAPDEDAAGAEDAENE